MTNHPAKLNSAAHTSRCEHRFSNGTRCRLPVPAADARFCSSHAKLPQNRAAAADLADTLTAGLGEFHSAANINDFLSRLLLLVAQDRISPRRAAVLAYITNQLLRTVAALDRENDRENEPQHQHPTIIGDMPGPPRPRATASSPETAAGALITGSEAP